MSLPSTFSPKYRCSESLHAAEMGGLNAKWRIIVIKEQLFAEGRVLRRSANQGAVLGLIAAVLREVFMPDRKNMMTIFFVGMLVFQTAGCGTSSSNRVLQSVKVTPAMADGLRSPTGQVQFTATGTFSKSPSPAPVTFVAPYSGSWVVSDPTIATLVGTGTGTATFQCVAGASGTVTITAAASTNAATGTGATSTMVQGTASLTCP